MIVYIAGKITGDAGYRDRFVDAQMTLEHLGHTVLNPAILPDGLGYEQYMRIGKAMLSEAEAICLLPNWQDSSGAKREYMDAQAMKKRILYYEKISLYRWA